VHATKETLLGKVSEVKQYLRKSSETLRDKTDAATLQAKSLTNQAVAEFPLPVSGRIEQLRQAARQRSVPAVAVVLGVLALLLVLRRLLRRHG
jgi:molecular chaperone GrpE (heat shock protein)